MKFDQLAELQLFLCVGFQEHYRRQGAFTTRPLAPDQIFMTTNSIKHVLQPWHVIQILWCAP